MHPLLRIIGLNSVTWPKTAAREAGSFLWTWKCWWMQSRESAHGEVAPLPSVLRGPFIISCREEASQWFYCRCLSFLGVNHVSWHFFFFFLVCLFLRKFLCFLICASLEILLFSLLFSPKPPPPFLSQDSVSTQSVLLENSSYLKWMTQFPPPRPNYMFSVHNSLLFIIFWATRLCGVFHRHSPSGDIWSLPRAGSPMTHRDVGHCAEILGGTAASRSPRNTVFPIFPS